MTAGGAGEAGAGGQNLPDGHGPELSEQRGLAAWLPRRLAEERPAVLVVGDLILDGWWSGPSDRMCREAPAPVVDINRREFSPGGAANTAMNLASLGARVSVAGLIGTDDAGTELKRQLLAAGVDTTFLMEDPDLVTTTKIRISSGGQVLLRFDDAAAEVPEDALAALAAVLPAAVERQDAVVPWPGADRTSWWWWMPMTPARGRVWNRTSLRPTRRRPRGCWIAACRAVRSAPPW